MKRKDIRIGNYLLHWGEIHKVRAIRKVSLSSDNIKNNDKFAAHKNTYEGIPLTEQWLNDLGFVQDDDDFLYTITDRIDLHININKKRILLESYDGIITLKYKEYVHEIQNLIHALKK